jgi:hypothetical protein
VRFGRWLVSRHRRAGITHPAPRLSHRGDYAVFQPRSARPGRQYDRRPNIAKAEQTTCNLNPEFSLSKNRDNAQPSSTSSWQILHRGRLVYEINRKELNDIYGGYSSGHGGNPPIDCSNIVIGADFFALRMGWQNDLLMAFGIERGPSGLRGVRILRYFAHDHEMALSAFNNELYATYGRKRDLEARFCWNPTNKNDNRWWHNADHRAGRGPCVSNIWPWEYPTTSEQEILID